MTIAVEFIKKLQDATGKEPFTKKFWQDYDGHSATPFQKVLENYAAYYESLTDDLQKKSLSQIFWQQVKAVGTPIIENRTDGQCDVYFLFPKNKKSEKEAKKDFYLQGDFHGYNSTRETQKLSELSDTGIMWRQDVMPKDSIVVYQYVQVESIGASLETQSACEDKYSQHNFPYRLESKDRVFRVNTDSAYIPGEPINWPGLLSKDAQQDKRHFVFHTTLYSDKKDEMHHSDAEVKQTYNDDLYFSDQIPNSPYAKYTRAVQVFRPTSCPVDNIVVVNDGTPYLMTGILEQFEKMVREEKLSPNTALVLINPLPGLKETLSEEEVKSYNNNEQVKNPGMGVRFIDFQYRIDQYADFIENKLFPELKKQMINVPEDPNRRVLVGSSLSGTASLYIGLTRPKLFGAVVAQSPSPANRVILMKEIESKRTPSNIGSNIHLSCGAFECPERAAANDNIGYAKELSSKLGIPLLIGAHGHAFVAWVEELEQSLPSLLPAPKLAESKQQYVSKETIAFSGTAQTAALLGVSPSALASVNRMTDKKDESASESIQPKHEDLTGKDKQATLEQDLSVSKKRSHS